MVGSNGAKDIWVTDKLREEVHSLHQHMAGGRGSDDCSVIGSIQPHQDAGPEAAFATLVSKCWLQPVATVDKATTRSTLW